MTQKLMIMQPSKEISLGDIRFAKKLPGGAKILFAELCEMSQKNGYFQYQVKKLANLYSVSEFTVRKWLYLLAERNFIVLTAKIVNGKRQDVIEIKQS